MTGADEQQVPYFGTPIGFTQTVRMRRLRRSLGRVEAERVAAWYAQMRDLAKQGRVMGEFSTDIESFVDSYGGWVPDRDDVVYGEWFDGCAQAWSAFEREGLVEIDGQVTDLDRPFRVRVRDFHETNSARPSRLSRLSQEERDARDRASARERKRRERDRKRDTEPVDKQELSRHVTDCHSDSHGHALQDETYEVRTTPSSPPVVTGLPLDKMTAQDEVDFADRAAALFATVVADGQDPRVPAEKLMLSARRPHPHTRQRLPLEAWERALNDVVSKVRAGRLKLTGDPVGYIVQAAPSMAIGGDTKLKTFDAAPEQPTVDDTAVRESLRAFEARRGVAS